MRHTLRCLTGHDVNGADFTDDRLTDLLRYLSDGETWERTENDLSRRTVSVHELPAETVRCDATTVSGYHEVTEDGMFRFGHSKDDPGLPQIKMMTAAPDPPGMPVATDIVSGEKADDPLHVPVIRRVASCLGKRGLLYVSDCAAATRRHIVSDEAGGHCLCPLPRTGDAAGDIERWADRGGIKEEEGSLGEVSHGQGVCAETQTGRSLRRKRRERGRKRFEKIPDLDKDIREIRGLSERMLSERIARWNT